MTRDEAYLIADEFIPEVWGSARSAWIWGFMDGRQIGIHRYPRTSVCYKYLQQGKKDRKIWNTRSE